VHLSVRIRLRLPLLLLWALALGVPDAGAARAKKLIEWGWDEPDAAFLRSHIREMEATPFDGCVYHIKYERAPGDTGNFSWDCWGRHLFTEAELQASIDDLKATPFRRFRQNFLRFNVTPGNVDWFDDFSTVVANAELAARIAQAAGSRGILFDIEQYQGPVFDYHKQQHASERSWREYATQTRLRGREVMEAFQRGYPGITVFLSYGYSIVWKESRGGWRALEHCSYGLLAPFLDGLVDGAKGRTRLVDGHESSYPEKDPRRFPVYYRQMKKELLPIVAQPAKYRRVFTFSFGIWMDNDWRKNGWDPDRPDRNYRTPADFGPVVRKALQTADEFVWIYSETPRWWTVAGRPTKLPKGYEDAVRRARRGLTAD
jgi:hypothetical protein